MMSTDTDESLLQSRNDSENGQIQLCLICCSNVETNQLENRTESISKNVEVVFLLKNLLQVPSVQLERNLKEYGNPESWVYLCEQCAKLITQAKCLHFQIIQMTRELKSLKKLIVSKTRSSSNKNSSLGNCKRKAVWKSTRNFVLNYGYISSSSADLINPFIEGDRLARYLVTEHAHNTHQSSPSQDNETSQPFPDVKVEPDDDDNDTGSFSNNSNYGDNDDQEDAEIDADQKVSTDSYSSVKLSTSKDQPSSELPWLPNRKNKKMVRINGRWKCRYCDKLFASTRTVYTHEHTKHVPFNSKAKHVCDICGKACSTIAHLSMHRRSIHKIRLDGKPASQASKVPDDPQSCNLCGKVFKCKMNLEVHVKYVHEKVLEHSCHLCGMKFAISSYLKRHQLAVHKDDPGIKKLIAEGIRIWRCKVKGCRAQFMKKSNLEKHSAKIHNSRRNGNSNTNKKRFTCGYCGKGFWSKDYHRTHELLHKNEDKKPYCCELCGLGFAAPLYLSNHKSRSHKKETEKSDPND